MKLFYYLVLLSLVGSIADAKPLYVDGRTGDDRNDGLSATSAWQTLQRAADVVAAGDTVWVADGVYRGAVQLYNKGTATAPIVFRAAPGASVTISNADPKIRAKAIEWELEDSALGLYSVPFTGGDPARVLYNQNDLFPYMDLDHLKTFRTSIEAPGPRHGYFLDTRNARLYVRLHASGKYGSTDPNDNLMAVAPPTGTHREGTLVGAPQHYCFGVLGAGDAHVILDGFVYETPGLAGVYVEANHVTVRRSWFYGCRTGVSGNYLDRFTDDVTGEDYFSLVLDPYSQARSASDIVIENCEFTQHPLYADAREVMSDPVARASVPENHNIYWARKSAEGLPSEKFKYEIGVASRIGNDWTIRRNYVHDSFEGLSCHATWASDGLLVEENVFERLLDNAVETEDHSTNMMIRRNVIINTLEAFSFQPLRGEPWPGPAYFVQNIIWNDEEEAKLWLPFRPHERGAFKIGIKSNTWERARHMRGQPVPSHFDLPAPGIIIAHNTVFFRGGRLITTQGDIERPLVGVKFYNNVLGGEYLAREAPRDREFRSGHFYFDHNVVTQVKPGAGPFGEVATENGGWFLGSENQLKLEADFRPRRDSPLRRQAVPVTEVDLDFPDIGAIQPGDAWYPLEVGPSAPLLDESSRSRFKTKNE